MNRIATHQKPDADALLSTYLLQRYAFAGEAEIVFIGRGARLDGFACAVDVGRQYDPARGRFDHKPPAFPDRNASCAARLVWEWLLAQGAEVGAWRELVAIVHQGDARPPRRAGPELEASRREGFHALVKAARLENASDAALYRRAVTWLDDWLDARNF